MVLAFGLHRLLEKRQPIIVQDYLAILGSLLPLWRAYPELRMRAFMQALLFAVFSLIWTMAPLLLTKRYGLDACGVALFVLAGVPAP